MTTKLIIFVVFVSVLYNVLDSSHAASGEITAQTFQETFDRINEPVNVIILETSTVFKTIINSLRNSTEQILSNDQPQDANSTTFDSTEALERLREALNNILNATSIAAGGTCPTGMSFQSSSYGNARTAIQSIERAIARAKAGEYPANEAELENDKNETQRALLRIECNIVNLIRRCLNTNNRDEGREVLQTVKNGIQTSFVALVNSLYNVIIILATVVSDNTSYDIDEALTDIDSNLVNALSAIAGFAAYLSGILESCSLDRELGGTDILNTLYISRYYEKVSVYHENNTFDVISTADVNRLEKRTNVIEIGRLNYYPATLANQSAAFVEASTTIYALLDAIEQTQPISAPKVNAIRLILPAIAEVFSTGWFGSIAIADNNGLLCSTAPTTIGLIDTTQVPLVAGLVIAALIAISNNLITALQQLLPVTECAAVPAFNYITDSNHLIYNGSTYLSNIVCGNQAVTQADYVEIRDILYEGKLVFAKGIVLIHRTNLIQVLNNHGYTVGSNETCSSDLASLLQGIGSTFASVFGNLGSDINQSITKVANLPNVVQKVTDNLNNGPLRGLLTSLGL